MNFDKNYTKLRKNFSHSGLGMFFGRDHRNTSGPKIYHKIKQSTYFITNYKIVAYLSLALFEIFH